MTTTEAGTVHERVEDLLERMTLAEKIAQLGSQFAFNLLAPEGVDAGEFARRAPDGIGQVTRLAGATGLRRADLVARANEIQRHLLDHTRLGIPAIVHEECLAGYMARDAEIFPQPLGLASSWDPDLSQRMGAAIARQMRLAGAHFGLGPVLDIARDPRWGRVEETYGEDPHLASVMGLAMVIGLQRDGDGTGILATAKHFVGHGAPEGGRNAATPHIPPRELVEVFMAPFEQAVRHGRVEALMHAYHDLDGIPCIANEELLNGVLRQQWGFAGTVVSDYNGVEELHEAHRLVPDLEHAAAVALSSGLDVELPESSGFGAPLERALADGLVTKSAVDDAVRRVLRQKFELGLFEDPFVDPARLEAADDDAREVAREAALGSIIMLQNRDGLLPLASPSKVALIGPHAQSGRGMLGDYAHVAHQQLLVEMSSRSLAGSPPIPEYLELATELEGVESIADALARELPADLHVLAGCAINDDDRSGIAAAVELAADADVAVLAVGELSGLTPECTTGESRDRVELGLPGVQQELVEAVVATGTPTVLVLVSGRPNSIGWAAEHIGSILWAPLPGRFGAEAIANVVTGAAEPIGRLPITVPRHVGQIPIHYLHNPSSFRSRWRDDYVESSYTPLWAFGHGRGYTTFELGAVTGPASVGADERGRPPRCARAQPR